MIAVFAEVVEIVTAGAAAPSGARTKIMSWVHDFARTIEAKRAKSNHPPKPSADFCPRSVRGGSCEPAGPTLLVSGPNLLTVRALARAQPPRAVLSPRG